jgi:GxxExxY protein
MMVELLYGELSYLVVGAALEVHKVLGPGFLEVVYQHALAHELALRNVPFEQQVALLVMYKDQRAGDYRADFVVDGKMILEIKAASTLAPLHEAQALHYLAATRLRLAILLNFGAASLQIKRIVR